LLDKAVAKKTQSALLKVVHRYTRTEAGSSNLGGPINVSPFKHKALSSLLLDKAVAKKTQSALLKVVHRYTRTEAGSSNLGGPNSFLLLFC